MNRLITRLILAFVSSSLALTLLPLLQRGGAPLIAVLDRSQSLVVYAAFLMLFAVFVLPRFLRGEVAGRSRWPWLALAAYFILFAAIPLVFTAYISGVSANGLLRVAAVAAGAMALPVLVARLVGGRRSSGGCAMVGGVLFFAVPGVSMYLESVGLRSPAWLDAASPWHGLHRIAVLREVPQPLWPFLVFPALIWLLAAVPSPRRLSAAAAALLVVAMLGGGASGVGGEPVQVESLSGGVAREGMRTALRIQLPRSTGSAVVSAGPDGVRVPCDGLPHEVTLTLGEGARRLRVERGADVEFEPLPLTLVPAGRLLVGWLGRGDAPASLAATGARVIGLELPSLPDLPGALEAFDVMVCPAAVWEQRDAGSESAVLRWVTLGGVLQITGAGSGAARELGAGRIVDVARGAPLTLPSPGGVRPTALDDGLTTTFAPPDWQEMDLTALLLFAAMYHGAFLLAFLLPLLLDSQKSLTVYLVSVGFVVLVMAALAWQVLGTIFLKDNQVYTHAITIMVVDDAEEPRVVSRQFLCFASMSAESRDIAFPQGSDLMVYRSPHTDRRVVRRSEGDRVVLEDVQLDRFENKLVVRVDREAALPLRLQDGERGLRLVPRGDVTDALDLAELPFREAWRISGGKVVRRFQVSEGVLVDRGPASTLDIPREVQLHVGKLLGHFAPRRDSWLLLRVDGVPRGDVGREWLWSRDLGAWLLLPMEG